MGRMGLRTVMSEPWGTFISRTMIVMMMAKTPSLKASRRFFSMARMVGSVCGVKRKKVRGNCGRRALMRKSPWGVTLKIRHCRERVLRQSWGVQNQGLSGLSFLILEDEPLLRKQAGAFLERLGADVTIAENVGRARRLIEDLSFDFALIDVNLPDGLGTDLLREKVFPPNTGVIVMTAEGGVNGAIDAMKLGAIDYLSKPFDLAELPLIIGRARKAKSEQRIEEQKRTDTEQNLFFFGSALAMMQGQLEKILAADRRLQESLPPVLIEGETGVGKTTIARWIHHSGPRASAQLVEVNCSALPETLAESELFGHERGAFTDARSARMGLFEAASGGTLFLDELPSLRSEEHT